VATFVIGDAALLLRIQQQPAHGSQHQLLERVGEIAAGHLILLAARS
jgi:hypothetical protein